MSATPNGKERWMALDDIPGIATRDELIGQRRSRGADHDVRDHLEAMSLIVRGFDCQGASTRVRRGAEPARRVGDGGIGRIGEHSGLGCVRRKEEKNH